MNSSRPEFGCCQKCGARALYADLLPRGGLCPHCCTQPVDKRPPIPDYIHQQDYRLAMSILARANLSRAAVDAFARQYRDSSARPGGVWICGACAATLVDCAQDAPRGDDGDLAPGWRTRLASLIAGSCRQCRAAASAIPAALVARPPERRRSVRFQIKDKPALYCAHLPAVGSSRRELGVEVVDLSETGLRCLLKRPLDPGENVFVRIQTGQDELISAYGQVRWNRASLNSSYEHGVEFTQLEESMRARIGRLREQCLG